MSHTSDNALHAIIEATGDLGFRDPLAGVDSRLPEGAAPADLAAYCLMLGDDALVMSHRLQQWCTRAPELEEEVALANIALDLLGQARLLLSRAAQIRNGAEDAGRGTAEGAAAGRWDEDRLAFFRDAAGFRNVRFAEAPHDDFAHAMVRLLVFSAWRLALLDRLSSSRDPVLAAVAAKGVKEVAYHRDHAAGWTVRLGDGTELSHLRAQRAWDAVLPEAAELLHVHEVEGRLAAAGVAADPSTARGELEDVLARVAEAATLRHRPPGRAPDGGTGRYGLHTPELDSLLAELQEVARAHPEATW
uniref:1,2-phenylacetyl-CoA epoxidase subunit PaaC n=1 Tax=Nonomuraea pusilla TaxID=46177 RepID=UPI000A5BF675|nr:1,2-phenylacetyl-CoA epoxidase subunit PaaC [Nonomuraea pusilla]